MSDFEKWFANYNQPPMMTMMARTFMGRAGQLFNLNQGESR